MRAKSVHCFSSHLLLLLYIYIFYIYRPPDESFKTKQPVGVYFIYFIVHCFSSYLFYALIPFIEHFLKQRRFMY